MACIQIILLVCVAFRVADFKLNILTTSGDKNFLFLKDKHNIETKKVGFVYNDENGAFAIDQSDCAKAKSGKKYFFINADCTVNATNQARQPDVIGHTEFNVPEEGSIANIYYSKYKANYSVSYRPRAIFMAMKIGRKMPPPARVLTMCNDMSSTKTHNLIFLETSFYTYYFLIASKSTVDDFRPIMKCIFILYTADYKIGLLSLMATVHISNHVSKPVAFQAKQVERDYAVLYPKVAETTPVGNQIGYIDGRSGCPEVSTHMSFPNGTECKGPIILKETLLDSYIDHLSFVYNNKSYSTDVYYKPFCKYPLRGHVIATGSSIDTAVWLNLSATIGLKKFNEVTYDINDGYSAWGVYPSGNLFIKKSYISSLRSGYYTILINAVEALKTTTCMANIDVINDLTYPRFCHIHAYRDLIVFGSNNMIFAMVTAYILSYASILCFIPRGDENKILFSHLK